jgi:hypothetical protein
VLIKILKHVGLQFCHPYIGDFVNLKVEYAVMGKWYQKHHKQASTCICHLIPNFKRLEKLASVMMVEHF